MLWKGAVESAPLYRQVFSPCARMMRYASAYSPGFLPSPMRQTQVINPSYLRMSASRSGYNSLPISY